MFGGLLTGPAAAGEWSGYVAAELRAFPQQALDPEQHDTNLSLAFEPEFYTAWDDGAQSFTFKPYLRLDSGDDRRSHTDLRELMWLRAGDGWEFRAGVGRVFWGVTEALHLVDIINQTDLVENLDGEDKLGQPMLKLSLEQDWGFLDLFVLPGFRERTYPGEDGRLRTHPRVDTSRAEYESGTEDKHVDFALRWSRSLGDWDLGLAHFHGTSRDPRLLPALIEGEPRLIPFYDIIDQTSLDVQFTRGDWLWKLEALTRGGQEERYAAATGGFEYTRVGIVQSDADLGLLAEGMWDSRGSDAPTAFQKDLFVGLRLTLNDVQSTELLGGVIQDLGSQARFLNLEASRRLGNAWKLSLEGRFFSNIPDNDPFTGIRRDGYLQIELARYF